MDVHEIINMILKSVEATFLSSEEKQKLTYEIKEKINVIMNDEGPREK